MRKKKLESIAMMAAIESVFMMISVSWNSGSNEAETIAKKISRIAGGEIGEDLDVLSKYNFVRIANLLGMTVFIQVMEGSLSYKLLEPTIQKIVKGCPSFLDIIEDIHDFLEMHSTIKK